MDFVHICLDILKLPFTRFVSICITLFLYRLYFVRLVSNFFLPFRHFTHVKSLFSLTARTWAKISVLCWSISRFSSFY